MELVTLNFGVARGTEATAYCLRLTAYCPLPTAHSSLLTAN